MKSLKISGRMVARNTILNLLGQTVPLILGIVTIPFILRGLGDERFGLLSIIWVILGYFTIFDLGLGRATTKYVAEVLGKNEPGQVSNIVWTAVSMETLLGIIGAMVVLLFTPLLVEHVLKISPLLIPEARATFYALGFSVPIVLVSGSFSGVLEAAQRFDLINAVKIPVSILTYLLPVVGLLMHIKLPGIVMLILAARLFALISFVILVLYFMPQLRKYNVSSSLIKKLVSFGGWITVSSIVGPILQYLDRFLIGAIMSMTIVAYYTAPFDVINRLWVIPGSLVLTIFPAFSSIGVARKEDLKYFLLRGSKYMFLTVGLITLVIILFAREILSVWLGAVFAEKSTLVFQILAIGVLIGSLTHLILALFQGIGRPDISAKIQLVLLPISAVLSVILIGKIGIIGAALAWSICRLIGIALSLRISWKLVDLNRSALAKNGLFAECAGFLILAGLLTPLLFLNNTSVKWLGTFILCSLTIILSWRYVFDTQDRAMVGSFFGRFFCPVNGTRQIKKKTLSRKD